MTIDQPATTPTVNYNVTGKPGIVTIDRYGIVGNTVLPDFGIVKIVQSYQKVRSFRSKIMQIFFSHSLISYLLFCNLYILYSSQYFSSTDYTITVPYSKILNSST